MAAGARGPRVAVRGRAGASRARRAVETSAQSAGGTRRVTGEDPRLGQSPTAGNDLAGWGGADFGAVGGRSSGLWGASPGSRKRWLGVLVATARDQRILLQGFGRAATTAMAEARTRRVGWSRSGDGA